SGRRATWRTRGEADQPANLFDVVVRVSQVGAPTRWSDRQVVTLIADRCANRLQQAYHREMINMGTENSRGQRVGDRGARAHGNRAPYRLSCHQRAASMLDQEGSDGG